MSAPRWPLALAIVGVLAVTAAAAPTAPAFPDKTERLIGLARIWSYVKFYHPYLGYQAIDWDAPLVAAIPKVEAATDEAAYGAAVQGMLDALHDPATHVEPAAAPAPATPPTPAATPPDWLTWPSKDVMLVDLGALLAARSDYTGVSDAADRVVTEAAKAKVLVIDLGTRAGAETSGQNAFALGMMVPVMPATDAWPSERMIEHHGYRPQVGTTSGAYFSTFITLGGEAARPAPATGPAHVVFVIRAGVGVPALALALQAAGHATLVTTGRLDDASAITTTDHELPGGLHVTIRLTELVWGAIAGDVIVGKGQDPRARALAIARAPIRPRPARRAAAASSLPGYRSTTDDDYAAQRYPSRELRLLAGIRLWAVLDVFHTYRSLVPDWDGVLREMLPRLEAAADAEGYLTTLREMVARVHDGHISVYLADWTKAPPRGMPPFVTRRIEGQLTIIRLLDAAIAGELGLAVGDVVETIDGTPAADAMTALYPTISATTAADRAQSAAMRVLYGPEGSPVTLGVRGAAGPRRDVIVTRTRDNMALYRQPGTAPHWRRISDDLGYVDLTELIVPEVDAMFDAMKGTRALIFDMRGYPNGTAWAIAPRINTKHATHTTMILQPLRTGQSPSTSDVDDGRFYFLQPMPTTDKPIYTGKIFVLIDERAVSQAEHSCLFYREATDVTFIGSTTNGTNGDVTTARLPGGLEMSFTGEEIRYLDGSQLQQVGVQPHLPVRQTVAGVRAGKDEVLERAIARAAAGK